MIKGNPLGIMEFRRQSKLWYYIEDILQACLRQMDQTIVYKSYKALKEPYIVAHSSNLARREPFQRLIRHLNRSKNQRGAPDRISRPHS